MESSPGEPRAADVYPTGKADLSLLEDKLPAGLKATKSLAILTGVVGAIYFLMSRWPVFHTDIWGHLAYGRWMVEHGALPQTEPLMALAQGVPWVDTAWLSKVIGYWSFTQFGIAGLQFLHAACVAGAFGLLAWSLRRRSVNVPFTLLGLLAFLLVGWKQLVIQRPQDAGLLCFTLLFVAAMNSRPSRAAWVLVPVLFAVWANLHGSFPMGLVLLGAVGVGHAFDLWRRTGRVKLALGSWSVWRPLLLMQLGAAAALVNPRGLGIYSDILTISGNANLQALMDWSPLTLRMFQGQMVALTVIGLIAAYRWSPRRITATEALLLLGFGFGSLWSVRMIVWWAPIAGYFLALHGQAAWRRRVQAPVVAPAEERRGLWTIATIGLAWIAFAYSPFGLQRLHGMPEGEVAAKEFRRSVSRQTPLDAVAYLTEHADEIPAGLMYNAHEWGDYLEWAAPKKFQVFSNLHAHLVPREVWEDLLLIHMGGSGWDDKLDRYGVNSILVDTTNYDRLIHSLKRADAWQEVYRDPQGEAVLFVRKNPV